jgi:hypothetical protein
VPVVSKLHTHIYLFLSKSSRLTQRYCPNHPGTKYKVVTKLEFGQDMARGMQPKSPRMSSMEAA